MVVSTAAVTAAGTTMLLVDASRTCRRPRALLRGRASKSEQTRPRREIARATTSGQPFRAPQEARCHRVPPLLLSFARAREGSL